jgi:cell division protein FtsW (lipid II flippase)
MIDTTALLIAGMETKYVVLGALCIVAAGIFTALYFSLKQYSNKSTLHYNVD